MKETLGLFILLLQGCAGIWTSFQLGHRIVLLLIAVFLSTLNYYVGEGSNQSPCSSRNCLSSYLSAPFLRLLLSEPGRLPPPLQRGDPPRRRRLRQGEEEGHERAAEEDEGREDQVVEAEGGGFLKIRDMTY